MVSTAAPWANMPPPPRPSYNGGNADVPEYSSPENSGNAFPSSLAPDSQAPTSSGDDAAAARFEGGFNFGEGANEDDIDMMANGSSMLGELMEGGVSGLNDDWARNGGAAGAHHPASTGKHTASLMQPAGAHHQTQMQTRFPGAHPITNGALAVGNVEDMLADLDDSWQPSFMGEAAKQQMQQLGLSPGMTGMRPGLVGLSFSPGMQGLQQTGLSPLGCSPVGSVVRMPANVSKCSRTFGTATPQDPFSIISSVAQLKGNPFISFLYNAADPSGAAGSGGGNVQQQQQQQQQQVAGSNSSKASPSATEDSGSSGDNDLEQEKLDAADLLDLEDDIDEDLDLEDTDDLLHHF
jgi:hypothetical protein